MTHATGNGNPTEWKNYSVLIVSAAGRSSATTGSTLRAAGFSVTEVTSGAEGLSQAGQNFSAVVADIELNDSDGFRFCQALRANQDTAGLPVILISAPGISTEHKHAALDAGADACLVHPVDAVVLLSMTQALVRARAAELSSPNAGDAAPHGVDEPEVAKELQAEVDAIEHAVASVLDSAVNDRTLLALNAILTSTQAQSRLLSNAPEEGPARA